MKPLVPKDARTMDQICDLPRDNVGYGDWYIGFNGPTELYFGEQAIGEDAKQRMTMPRHVFEKFVRWYETGSMKKPTDAKEK